jgi:electron transfer flavoprotein beta subunit
MKIAVCFKQVPDSSTRVKIADDGRQINSEGVSYVINPYDELAIAKARELADASDGEVTVITIGPERVKTDLRKILAMGGDRALHLQCESAPDALHAAEVVAAEINAGGFDLVLTGKQAIDDDMAQFAQLLGATLGWATATVVVDLQISGDTVTAIKEIEGGKARFTMQLPCVISSQRGIAEKIHPPIKAQLAAKKKPVEGKSMPAGEDHLETLKMELPPDKGAGKILTDGADSVPELLQLLRTEAKVISSGGGA